VEAKESRKISGLEAAMKYLLDTKNQARNSPTSSKLEPKSGVGRVGPWERS
jgi:hypothetical protein